tara:strand:+ start:1193 stop:2239 length:1047 start_codon:yes stop_codon:yes gene_type:complete
MTRSVAGGDSMSVLINPEIDALLEGTSRSFYPTLRYLPKKMRGQVGLLYLLARIADTIADSRHGETDSLLRTLQEYNDAAQGKTEKLPDFSELANIQENPAEAELLRGVENVILSLPTYPKGDQERIRKCLDIIVGGQSLDLQRFGTAKEGGNISALKNESELDDYAYRVAGCVGEFWTEMSLAHLINMESKEIDNFMHLGVRFGKALQMINILRDIPEDLRFGRCYIPIDSMTKNGLKPEDLMDSENINKFREMYDGYIEIASEHMDAAIEYIGKLPFTQFRLRAACMLPVLIGQKTLTLLRDENVLDPEKRVKVSRSEIKKYSKRMVLSLIIPGGSRRLLERNRNA